jgi:hypothetical protein
VFQNGREAAWSGWAAAILVSVLVSIVFNSYLSKFKTALISFESGARTGELIFYIDWLDQHSQVIFIFILICWNHLGLKFWGLSIPFLGSLKFAILVSFYLFYDNYLMLRIGLNFYLLKLEVWDLLITKLRAKLIYVSSVANFTKCSLYSTSKDWIKRVKITSWSFNGNIFYDCR